MRPCLRQYGIEQEVKALVARSCGSDGVQRRVRVRIVTRIRETVAVPGVGVVTTQTSVTTVTDE